MERRSLETYAVALWAEKRLKSPFSFTRDVIALGDVNMPKRDPSDPILKALTAKGLHVPHHSTAMGSNLAGDAHYDQIAFFPGETQSHFTGNHGVFDFDAVVFADLWNGGRGKRNSIPKSGTTSLTIGQSGWSSELYRSLEGRLKYRGVLLTSPFLRLGWGRKSIVSTPH